MRRWLTPRRRLTLRIFAAGTVGLAGLPVLLPLLALRVGYQTWARALGWPAPRRRGAWVHVWWWYGYRLGLYRLDWAMKDRARRRLSRPPTPTVVVRDDHDPDDWFAEPPGGLMVRWSEPWP